MNTKSPILIRKMLFLFFLVALLVLFWSGMVESPVVRAEAGDPTVTPEPTSEYFTSTTITLEDGRQIEGITIHGPPQPPVGYERATVSLPYSASAQGIVTLSVPAFDWSFGCSATSGSMIAAYYDRNGYPNIYTGPTSGGVMPMDSSSWPDWTDGHGDTYGQCPLTASRNGLDSRMTRGSMDDYWVSYLSGVQDPFITNGWAEHTWGDAIGDYMKTSQSNYGNDDGSTTFYTWTNNRGQLTCNDMVTNGITEDGTYGRKLFYAAKGYTVTDCYNQKTDNNKGDFTFALYMAEIDAGWPVMLNLAGHTVVGVGYDNTTNTVYLHDTWDYLTHTMTWGGSYSGMKLQSVSIVNLVPLNTYTLSVSKSGTGSGTVTSSPAGINCGLTCSVSFNNNTSVTLTAGASTGSTFTGWSGSGCSGTGTCTVTMDAAKSVAATFTFTNQAPNQPVLVQPADNTTGITLTPTLQVTVSDPNADAMNVTFYGRAAGGGTGDDFRIVIFPDTQNESQYYPAVYTSQTTWIANNKATQNIVFATHVGDIVNTASSTTEWGNADTSMDILDTGNVFYSVGPGNHDLGGLYNNYFGIARFSAKTYYDGYYGSDNYNNYSLFSASGRDFILINLQYNPTTAMLDWADARLKQYATRRGIVVSHSILNIDNSFTSEGTTIFNALKDNNNLFLMLCGHMHSASDGAAYLAQLGDDGHTIHIMEADYQDHPSGGNGYLRILRFSPLDDKIYATTYSPYISAYITSSPDQMEMAYDMAGSAAFAVIGTANGVASGSNASISWTGLANGTRYDWFAVANDGITSTTSSTWGFTTMNPMIIVNDFANYRVFQRDIGGMSKSITISGTYSNMNWSRVEARVLWHGTNTAVVDWTTIDPTPGGGTFSGNLSVPQGGWYNVEIRALDTGGAVIGSSRGTNKWGVGMIILVIGQSNMVGNGQPPFTIANSDLAVNYSNAGRWEHLADPYDDESPPGAVDSDNDVISTYNVGGSMIPALANSLLQTFNFPIAFVPSAKGGSNLYVNENHYGWAYRNPSNHFDTSTLYGQSITKAQSVGGVELIIMHQGEADTNAHRSEAQYESDFTTMIGNYRQDLYATIPIFICQLGTIGIAGDPRTDADVVAIRNAQHDLDNGVNIFMAATAMDQPRMDDVHYTIPGLNAIGGRMAHTVKYYLGATSYYRGPAINSAVFSDRNRSQVIVTLNHRGGTDITPAMGITGFEVFDNSSSVTIQSAARYATDAVQLTLSRSISSGHTVTLRYLYGMTPNISGLVKDNSPLALPLENTTADLMVLNTYILNVSKSGGGSGTVTSSPAGINCGSTCSASFNYNTNVTLTAVSSTGSTFTGWSDSGCSGTGTCTVTMDAVKSVTANFTHLWQTWYLAEGYTGAGFGTYILIQNPNASAANVTITYMLQGGGILTRNVTVVGNSRYTVMAQNADQVGLDQAFSTKLVSDRPIIVERAMYWPKSADSVGGHDSAGASSPGYTWYLAEGYTGAGYGTYILVQNPNDSVANVTITYMLQAGGTVTRSISVPANSRDTIVAQDETQVGVDQAFATKLASDQPIIVERAMYFNNGGTDTMGVMQP